MKRRILSLICAVLLVIAWVGARVHARDDGPTSVDLIGFGGLAQGGGILLSWETGSELDLVGFNVYRALRPNGPYLQLNTTLIPAQNPGSPIGATYSLWDRGLRAGRVYYYKLEQLSMGGETTWHGPVAVPLRWRVRPAPVRPAP